MPSDRTGAVFTAAAIRVVITMYGWKKIRMPPLTSRRGQSVCSGKVIALTRKETIY